MILNFSKDILDSRDQAPLVSIEADLPSTRVNTVLHLWNVPVPGHV